MVIKIFFLVKALNTALFVSFVIELQKKIMDVRSYFSVWIIIWRSGEQANEPSTAPTATTAR